MAKSPIDANINQQIFRKDFPQIIALKRELAVITAGRLYNSGADYYAGTVLVYDTVAAAYKTYQGSSGSYDASGILYEDVFAVDFGGATGGALARIIRSGLVYKDALTGYDSGAKGDLDATEFPDSNGAVIVKF